MGRLLARLSSPRWMVHYSGRRSEGSWTGEGVAMNPGDMVAIQGYIGSHRVTGLLPNGLVKVRFGDRCWPLNPERLTVLGRVDPFVCPCVACQVKP